MRNFFNKYCFFAIIASILFAFNLQEATAQSVNNTSFEVNFKGDGTAFYTIDGKTGQLAYMLNFGLQSGNWLNYGTAYRESGLSPLHFKAIERGDSTGTSFYILDSQTGQLNFMSDFGQDAGNWTSYGKPLENVKITAFEAQATYSGMVFYSYDSMANQMYFMQDFGDQEGIWLPYGKYDY